MKKTVLIFMFFLSISIYGQKKSDFETQELLMFTKNKEVLCHLLNEQNQDLTIIYKSGLFAYINIFHKETEESALNELKITYFIHGNNLIIKDKKKILEYVKKELDKNDFLLKDFIDEAYNNALASIDNSAVELSNGFIISSVNRDFSSELNISVFELQKRQLTVSIYYNINL